MKQLTHSAKNHDLDNNQNFSADGNWIVYDTRNPGILESRSIEKVHVKTGEIVEVYEPSPYVPGQGPGVGAASFSPTENRIAFIHGPWASTGLSYDFTVRRGGCVWGEGNGDFGFADARDVTSPFTPGALRGGTHRHEWDGAGKWLGYTYNDHIMKKLGADLRTIGVTRLDSPVSVGNPQEEAFEGGGLGFSALVVRVVPNPKPGSEEIKKAAQDSWVGLKGYEKEDGTLQRARAFVGTLATAGGEDLDEVFIVDIPEDIQRAGRYGPLEGTETAFPAPPEGATQRRLTRTEEWDYPGVKGTCWSSPRGGWITFLATDEEGVDQIFAVRPTGGAPVQVTDFAQGISASPRWSPDGARLVSVDGEGRLFIVGAPGETMNLKSNEPAWLTDKGDSPAQKPVWSTKENLVAFNREAATGEGTFLQIFIARPPEGPVQE